MGKTITKTQEICIPERLFIHNLFICSRYTVQDLSDELDDNIITDINDEIKKVRCILTKYSQAYDDSILPDRFKRYVAGILDRKNENYDRPPHYCLLICYNKIKWVRETIEAKSKYLKFVSDGEKEGLDTLKDFKTSVSEEEKKDLDILCDFETCFNYFRKKLGASAVSEKQLKRILQLSGGAYNDNEQRLVSYLIKTVFPRICNLDGDYFKNRTWNQIVYNDIETMEQKIYPQVTSKVVGEIDEFFIGQFNDLCETDAKDYDKIGDILLIIYQKLIDLYKSNTLSVQPNKEINPNGSAGYVFNPNYSSDSSRIYDSYISSHILSFMRWLPMIPEDYRNIEFMESIDNVIEKIRDEVLSSVGTKISHDNFATHSNNSLFISNDNIDLRKLLIDVMHDEFCIHSQFHRYYGKTISISLNGGNDNE